MYELIILSILMNGPCHGYSMAKKINNIIGPIAKASNGRIYPLLAELQESGAVLTEEQQVGGRLIKGYCITKEGEKRFRELMLDTQSKPKEYQQIFSFKVTVLSLLEHDERLSIIEHYTDYCQAHLVHLAKKIEQIEQGRPTPIEKGDQALLNVIKHRLNQWELEKKWSENLHHTFSYSFL